MSVAGQGLLLASLAVFFLVSTVAAGATDPLAAAATAVLAALVGAFLLLCARALWRRRRWARGPVVAWQLLQLLTVVSTSFAGYRWAGALLVVASLVALVGLLTPTVVAETTGRADPPAV